MTESHSLPPSATASPETPSRSATIIAIANQKGGVGKTTTTINLGAALGVFNRKVLIVDCDPQGNASRGLGVEANAPNLYNVMTTGQPAADAIRSTPFPGVSVLPSNHELVGVEVEFVGSDGWEQRLRRALEPIRQDFDYVLMDCPPSLGHLTVTALAAADQILVPLQSEYFALEGISALVATVRRVQGRINPNLTIGGVIMTMYDDRTNLSRDVADEVRRHFPDRVFRSMVPRNVRLAEAPSHGLPILQYDVKSRGSLAYLAVARELLERAS